MKNTKELNKMLMPLVLTWFLSLDKEEMEEWTEETNKLLGDVQEERVQIGFLNEYRKGENKNES